MVSSAETGALNAGNVIDTVVEKSGLCLATAKSVNATQNMTFLGISFDSKKMTMQVTAEWMAEIEQELKYWSRNRARKKEIQLLAGKLQFTAKCCKHGRCFMARLPVSLKKVKHSVHYTHLNADFKRDIKWWQNLLSHFNSISVINTGEWALADTLIATDACL